MDGHVPTDAVTDVKFFVWGWWLTAKPPSTMVGCLSVLLLT